MSEQSPQRLTAIAMAMAKLPAKDSGSDTLTSRLT